MAEPPKKPKPLRVWVTQELLDRLKKAEWQVVKRHETQDLILVEFIGREDG